jgi:hypothetical protein
VEFALTPPLIDGGELRDGVVVSAILKIAGLYLVYPADFTCGHGELGADLDRGLRRPSGDRVQKQAGGIAPGPSELARLFAAGLGEFGSRWPGVESTFEVRVRLAVPDED